MSEEDPTDSGQGAGPSDGNPPRPTAPSPAKAGTAGAVSQGVVCNHCGHRQTSGSKLCDACGLRIDVPGALAADTAPAATTDEDAEFVTCGMCRTRNRAGTRACFQCQSLLPHAGEE